MDYQHHVDWWCTRREQLARVFDEAGEPEGAPRPSFKLSRQKREPRGYGDIGTMALRVKTGVRGPESLRQRGHAPERIMELSSR